MEQVTHISKSIDETMTIAGRFAKNLRPGDIVFLEGDLGAGKTVFTKGLAKVYGVNPDEVVSPTFVLMNIYEGDLTLYHFDLYRLENPKELKTLQFDEYFYGQGISIIEWPTRLGDLAPNEYWHVALKHKDEFQREICISYPSKPQHQIVL